MRRPAAIAAPSPAREPAPRRAARREYDITFTEMKKTTAITLTLLSAAALAACDGRRGPERVLAGYRDPTDTTRTSSRPRVGFVPFYRTVYRRDRPGGGSGGTYGGTYRGGGTSGGEGGHVGGVSRGGFGGTGGGRVVGS